jgi:CheY-like chemotaxis protein
MDPEPYLLLVVDDDSRVREITTALLENSFQVVQASNGLEALNLLESTLTPTVLSDSWTGLLNEISRRQPKCLTKDKRLECTESAKRKSPH